MRVVLIGYRGTGKSTVGALAAEALGWPFVDTDALIEHRVGMPIARIFAEAGEPRFRDLEAAVIAELADKDPAVISAGGGAVLRTDNVEHLRRNSLVVWLTADAMTLHRRIAADATTADRRPNLTPLTGLEEVQHLLAVREPHYRQAAHIRLDTGHLSAPQAAEQIIRHVRQT